MTKYLGEEGTKALVKKLNEQYQPKIFEIGVNERITPEQISYDLIEKMFSCQIIRVIGLKLSYKTPDDGGCIYSFEEDPDSYTDFSFGLYYGQMTAALVICGPFGVGELVIFDNIWGQIADEGKTFGELFVGCESDYWVPDAKPLPQIAQQPLPDISVTGSNGTTCSIKINNGSGDTGTIKLYDDPATIGSGLWSNGSTTIDKPNIAGAAKRLYDAINNKSNVRIIIGKAVYLSVYSKIISANTRMAKFTDDTTTYIFTVTKDGDNYTLDVKQELQVFEFGKQYNVDDLPTKFAIKGFRLDAQRENVVKDPDSMVYFKICKFKNATWFAYDVITVSGVLWPGERGCFDILTALQYGNEMTTLPVELYFTN